MSTTLDFYFDFGSPTAYLAYKRIKQLEEQYDLTVNYQPVLLGGLFKATDNMSPVAIPAKGMYMMAHDLPRFAKRYNVPMNMNPNFPINTLPLMRGAIAAQQMGCFENYCDAMYDAMWVEELNMGDPDIIQQRINQADIDADALIALTQDKAVKDQLIANTDAAVKRGAFGAPTMFIGDEMFFGQDRLDFVEERLQA
ncbi:2-hydroxychromene-2-carboxylate isomerase [Maricurvus nonylphenolicus]|uniref:2-hydroxychromene-2-carboxylate isomerase n=1 Tax=Maricurvus nonylphenolicus TaxID=1008307 RepID=UPI0036F2F07F